MYSTTKIIQFSNSTAFLESAAKYENFSIQILDNLLILFLLIACLLALQERDSNQLAVFNSNDLKWIGIHIICGLLSFFIVPIIIITVIPFAFIQLLVTKYLKFIYDTNFGGIMQGSDAIWTIEDVSKGIINTFLIIEYDKQFEEFYQTIQEVVDVKLFQQFTKLKCTREKFFGYNYFVKHNYNINKFIRVVHVNDSEFNEEYLQNFISQWSNKEMPINNRGLWELIIFDKPINKELGEQNGFVIYFRIHHCAIDGISAMRLLLDYFADPHLDITTKTVTVEKYNKLKRFLRHLYSLLFGTTIVMLQYFLKMPDFNSLHSESLIGDKLVAWKIEEKRNLIPLVKKIKSQIPNTTFLDIINTALSASLTDYFQKHSDIPESVTAVVPTLLEQPLQHADLFHNYFSVGMLTLPMGENRNILETLQHVRFHGDNLRKSPEFIVNSWLLSICTVLPEFLLSPLVYSAHCTMVFSNLPGTPKLTILNGKKLQDIVFFIPHRDTTGLGISLLSYDGRFQIGINVDKALISNYESANMILDNTFKYIEELYHEICSNKPFKRVGN